MRSTIGKWRETRQMQSPCEALTGAITRQISILWQAHPHNTIETKTKPYKMPMHLARPGNHAVLLYSTLNLQVCSRFPMSSYMPSPFSWQLQSSLKSSMEQQYHRNCNLSHCQWMDHCSVHSKPHYDSKLMNMKEAFFDYSQNDNFFNILSEFIPLKHTHTHTTNHIHENCIATYNLDGASPQYIWKTHSHCCNAYVFHLHRTHIMSCRSTPHLQPIYYKY